MTTQTSSHRRSNPQSLMDAREVVVHVENRESVKVVGEFLGKRVRQASEAAHTHPHVEILPFNVGSADMLRVRIAHNLCLGRSEDLCGAIALLSLRGGPIDLNQLREVYILAESIRNSVKYILWPSVVNWTRLERREAMS